MSLVAGDAVPDMTLAATSDQQINLTHMEGRQVVLYFYPKDATPGCTTEGQNFRDLSDDFHAVDTVIYGVSRDSLKKHENFRAKQCFPFELISDPDEQLCRAFDVIRMKKLYGKEHEGIERSTFLIDATGRIARVWRKVKVEGHAEEVLAAARALHAGDPIT
ncbi:peroxiredoxin [Kushneria phosphatilytica]|uniref:thioredoxin-dependent peroxiredoxin n=1 Tax=Kushneria phosphatilytica TaxID=657387 RepID=A0A1S1NZP1_9GAMM|nr:peroxiredoxin [Kushneria phosphatilytica]OHV13440.1 peroxiredoxin [Kushneria phosphatilytica]QEL10523.1 peroxiredoxin [Kushneria phosphatilytica]